MKNILVIQTAFLGDVILATAIIEKLHKDFPDASISMLVRQGNESLLHDHPFLKEVLVRKKKSGKWNELFSTISTVRKRKYDAVFNLHRFFSSGLITALSGASIRSGFKKNPLSFLFTHVAPHVIGDGTHEVERNVQLLNGIGDTTVVKPKLYPADSDFQATAIYKNKKFITLAPASVWFTKRLPAEKWVTLIQQTPAEFTVYLLGSPADVDLCNTILQAAGSPNVVNLAGKLSLLQSAALMKDSEMNYVNDSGPLHIGSAMNAPVTAFFCSTIPAFGFGPLSDQSFIIETKEQLTCRPCGLHGRTACPLQHFRCATTIIVPFPGSK